MEELLFRRQFLLSREAVPKLKSHWNHREIRQPGESWNLYTHPDLEVSESYREHATLILLGYCLDPFSIQATSQDVVERLNGLYSMISIVRETHLLNGRFLFLYVTTDGLRIINDATGFRELHFLREKGNVHCGSTPDIIKEYIGAEPSPDPGPLKFLSSKEYINNSFTWVGNKTIYRNIYKLPPNHQLDLHTGKVQRFWPEKPLEKGDPEQVAKEAGNYIRNSLETAFKRGPLHIGVTAGWDTRLLVAASKSLKDKVFFYINSSKNVDGESKDLQIARKLSQALDFKLNILEIEEVKDDARFRKFYKRNNYRAHDLLYPIFFFGYKRKYDHTYTVSGNLSEGSARKYYYLPFFMKGLNGEKIAQLVNFGNNSFAVKELNEWVKESESLCNSHHIDILDLYQIEQEASNWCSLTAAEQDIVREEIRPFNSRYLLSLLWPMPGKLRLLSNPAILKKMIEYLWSDALTVPVNPTYKNRVVSLLSRMGLGMFSYRMISTLKYLLKLDR